jgi:hypothetical protein
MSNLDLEFKCPFDNLEQLNNFVEKHKYVLKNCEIMCKVYSLKGIFYKLNDKGYPENILSNWALMIEYPNLKSKVLIHLSFNIEKHNLVDSEVKLLKEVDVTWSDYETKNSYHELLYVGNTNLSCEEIIIIGKSLVRTIEFQDQIYQKSQEFTNSLIDLIVLRINHTYTYGELRSYPFNTNFEAQIVLFGETSNDIILKNQKFFIKKNLSNNSPDNSLEMYKTLPDLLKDQGVFCTSLMNYQVNYWR